MYELLKDLCAKFPYGVIVRVHDIEHGDFDSYVDNISNSCIETHPIEELTIDFNPYAFYKLEEVKPYLRSMSSMTEEEMKELQGLVGSVIYDEENNTIVGFECNTFEQFTLLENWLNKNMFDYRGLIPMGLALEAPEDMYKKKEL